MDYGEVYFEYSGKEYEGTIMSFLSLGAVVRIDWKQTLRADPKVDLTGIYDYTVVPLRDLRCKQSAKPKNN